MSTLTTTPEREPRYRDSQIDKLLRDLRAEVKPHPEARRALVKVEARLVYLLKLLGEWDRTHAQRAEFLLHIGNHEGAAAAAACIFDVGLRHDLYRRAPVLGDGGAAERLAEAAEMGREVLV